MLQQTIHRSELNVRAELEGRSDLHVGFCALAYPELWSLSFTCAGVDLILHLSGKHIDTLYAQMIARLVIAPKIDREIRRQTHQAPRPRSMAYVRS